MQLGLHTGLGDHGGSRPLEALRDVWRACEALGYDAASIWDHFDAGARPGGGPCFEAVSLHTALAASTTRVRCGAFVYAAGHRPPAILAKAISTIDHVAGGRAEVGIGAGWAEEEHRAYGLGWAPAGERLDRLENTLAIVTALLHEGQASVDGTYATVTGAVCDPPPLQPRVPVWVGGTGERRTLRLVARWADGWNGGYLSPEAYAHKLAVLHAHCDAEGRDPASVATSVNLVAARDRDDLAVAFRGVVDHVAGGALLGSRHEMAETMQRYVEAGAQRLNVVVRVPADLEVVERVAAAAGKG